MKRNILTTTVEQLHKDVDFVRSQQQSDSGHILEFDKRYSASEKSFSGWQEAFNSDWWKKEEFPLKPLFEEKMSSLETWRKMDAIDRLVIMEAFQLVTLELQTPISIDELVAKFLRDVKPEDQTDDKIIKTTGYEVVIIGMTMLSYAPHLRMLERPQKLAASIMAVVKQGVEKMLIENINLSEPLPVDLATHASINMGMNWLGDLCRHMDR